MKPRRTLIRNIGQALIATGVAISLIGCSLAPSLQQTQAPFTAEKAQEVPPPPLSPKSNTNVVISGPQAAEKALGPGEVLLISGAAALYLEANPTAKPADVAKALIDNATDSALSDVGEESPNKLLNTEFIGATANAAPCTEQERCGRIKLVGARGFEPPTP